MIWDLVVVPKEKACYKYMFSKVAPDKRIMNSYFWRSSKFMNLYKRMIKVDLIWKPECCSSRQKTFSLSKMCAASSLCRAFAFWWAPWDQPAKKKHWGYFFMSFRLKIKLVHSFFYLQLLYFTFLFKRKRLLSFLGKIASGLESWKPRPGTNGNTALP